MTVYEELQARGLIAQVTSEEDVSKLINEGKATFYIGFDPTADSLHVGHFMALCLMKRLQMAGIEVLEARLSHLAYASEIAGAMLQRQQAEAIIDARTRIVEGAVGMVQMALEQLHSQGVVSLDEERKAQMVSNLLVVLCSDRGMQPVLNAGSLY